MAEKPEEQKQPDQKPSDKPGAPPPLISKVRKVTGDLGELATLGGLSLASKPTDFQFAMDRDLERLAAVRIGPWEEEAQRPAAVEEFKTVVANLKRRADRSGYALLSEVCVLFLQYLSHIAFGEQQRDAIENYLDAIRVISKKNLIGRGGLIGEEMLAELTSLNQRSGVKPRA